MSGPEFEEILSRYESSVIFGGMPTAEAVDYVKHIMLSSINYCRFESGEAPCLEPIDITFITPGKYLDVQAKAVVS